MNHKNRPRRKNLRRHGVRDTCGLLASVALASLMGGLSTPAHAQPPEDAEYRVGNLIESGRFTDTKAWTLKGFSVEGGGKISRKGDKNRIGTATTTFLGPDGYYKIRVRYQDEGDGISQATLTVGDKVIGSWKLDGVIVTTYPWKEFDGVHIKKGETIELAATKSGYENGRYFGMEILPSKPKPAAPDAKAVEKKEYSMNLVPVGVAATGKQKYLVGSGPLFVGSTGIYWVYLKKAEPFRMSVQPARAGGNPSLQYSLTKVGADKPTAEETIVTEENIPIFVKIRDAAEGLYELKVSTAPGDKSGIRVDFDAPGVRTEGIAEGYFFVPKGTKMLSAKARGHIVLMDASKQVMFDDWFLKEVGTPAVAVPAGSDGQLWYFQGDLRDLAGVPPYMAARRDAMLVPAEVLK